MAAVTVNSYRSNICGSYRQAFYNLSIVTSGDTLATALHTIKSINVNTTSISLAQPTGGTVAFTTSGAVNNALVELIGL